MKLRKQVLFALVLLTASSAWAQQSFSGGSGTIDAPYRISSTVDLDQLATNVNSGNSYSGIYFELTQDITYSYNTSTDAWDNANSTANNFTAIGTESRPFAGIFNGQNHTISGIRIYKDGNSSADNYQGLFGNNSGTIRNVVLANSRITGYQYIGGIAGNNNNTGTIDSCKVLNDVNIHSVYFSNCQKHGGIAGATSGTISNCVSSVQITEVAGVTSSSNYGGITGYGQGLSNNIAYGVNISAINPAFYKAAIIGYSSANDNTNNYYIDCSLININNGTNSTATTGIGRGGNNTYSDVDGVQQVCKVTLADEYVSVATEDPYITFNGTNYYKKWATFTLSHPDRVAQGYVFSNYSVTKDGTDPVQNVGVNESEGVFSFYMPDNHVTVKAVYNIQLTGQGTQQDPYIILDTNHLNYLATQVNSGQNDYSGKHFKLDADITYRHSTAWDNNNSTENNYTAIGYFYRAEDYRAFRGNLDGDNHTISGIRIHKNGVGGDDCNQGIFGCIEGGTIKNIILTDCRYTGYNDVGGIAGKMIGGKVSNCHVLSNVVIYAVSGSASGHGGVVGACNHGAGGIVEYCSSSAKVISRVVNNGGSDFGGLVGSGGGYVRNNLVIGATVDSARHWYGAISGSYENQGYYSNNYYRGCTVAGVANARNRGTLGGNIDGANPCFLITCGENISTNAMTFTIPAHGAVPETTYVFSTDQSEVHVYYNGQHDANREAELYVYRIDDNGIVYDTVNVTEGDIFQILHSDVSITLKGFNLLKTIEPNKWYAISSPLHDSVLNYPDEGFSLYFENIANGTNLATGTYDMFRYNESSMKWENQKASTGIAEGFSTLEAGRGYIYRIGGTSNATLRYRGVENSGDIYSMVYNSRPRPSGPPVPLDKNGGTEDANDDQLYGLNLIGNPYPHQVYYGTGINSTDLNMSFYYTLEPNGSWRIHLANENRPIGTFEAILVYASDTGLLEFSDNANPPAQNSGKTLMFTVSDGTNEDVAYAVMGTENEKGMPKIAHMEAGLPSLSIRMGGNRYAMAAIDAETSELPLHFSGKTGKYTISVEAMENADYLHLIDLQTGNDIDLLSQPTYTFTQSGNNTSAQGDRFLVKFSNSQLPTSNSLFAYQIGDQTIITGTGTLQLFDVMGRQLLSTEVDSSPFSLHRSQFPAPGVYILRADGQTQKIVTK